MIRALLAVLIATAMGCQSSTVGGAGSGEAKSAARRDAVVSWPELPATEFAPVALQKKGEVYELVDSIPVPGVMRPAAVKLPAASGAPFEVRDRDVAIRVRLLGQQEVEGVLKGDSLLFPGGLQGADVTLRALPTGVEDFISLDGKRAPSVDYEVELEGVAGLRLTMGTLEFLTSDGNPRLRMSTPVVLSKTGPSPVAVSLQGCAADTSTRAPWNRPVTAPGARRCTVHLGWELSPDGYPALLDPGWTTTASLNDRRSWQPTVTLGNGQVLVSGGFANGATAGTFAMVTTTELYDPVQGTWTRVAGATGPSVFNAPAIWIPAPISRAYVFGGGRAFAMLVQSSEVKAFDPVTSTWASVGTMLRGLEQHTATYMPSNGKVLIVGGTDTTGARVAAGELFTPSLTLPNTTVAAPNMGGFGARCCHVAALTGSGKVIVSHGLNAAAYNTLGMLYDPATNMISFPGSVVLGREFAAASSLADGRVLITGGAVDDGTAMGTLIARNTTELYQEGVGFTAGPAMAVVRYHHQQVRLTDNRILVAGGESPQNFSTVSTETWTPGAVSWVNGGNLSVARRESGIALTGEGYVIVAGGGQGNAGASTFVAVTSTESFELRPNGAACNGPGPCLSRNCVDGVCCNTACSGDCDACNISPTIGTCTPMPSTAVCRPLAAGSLCDVVENCTGNTATCPADLFLAVGTSCRASTDLCDRGETCPGNSSACPADVVVGAGQPCRASMGACDVAENCPGNAAACPTDVFDTTGIECRVRNGVCDVAEACNGTMAACPNDGLAPATTVCRGLQGTCDLVENCSGTTTTCGTDVLASQGSSCDMTYLCTGMDAGCPTTCTLNSDCITGATCIAGTCRAVRTNGAVCTADTQCVSGFCTDGVCCNSRCEGSCQACNVAGSAGTCTLAGRGEAGDPVCAPFVCDGKSPGCPTTCEDDAQCGPPAFCENKVCSKRTRGHVGFGCAGCSSVDGASLLGLLGAVMLLRRRAKGGR